MPDKKKQHFVPQFYLKNFSLNSARKSLGIFNLTTSKFIPNGSLKEQACKDYFYGRDLIVENALSELEKITANILRNILVQNSISTIISARDYYHLLEFTIFLNERTVCKADQLNESADKFIKAIASNDPNAPIGINEANFSLTQPTQFALHRAVICLPIVLDLSSKLLVNRTRIPFITSDHPVVRYNQLNESHIGLACKGFEIFLPISPHHLIVFFDRNVYKIGQNNNTSVDITKNTDVENLNLLQFLNANQNVYFNEKISEPQVRKLASRAIRYREKSRANVDEYLIGRGGGKKHVLLYTYTSNLKYSLKLSCIHILKKAKKISQKSDIHLVRDEELCRLHQIFLKLVDKKQYKANEFYTFLEDNHDRFNEKFYSDTRFFGL